MKVNSFSEALLKKYSVPTNKSHHQVEEGLNYSRAKNKNCEFNFWLVRQKRDR